MNGQTSTRPAEIERPQINEQQVEQRFQRRYEIATDELFRASVLPEVQRFNGLLEQELRRVNIRYFNEDDDTFPAAVQQAVDRVSEQYRQQNPNTLLSLYLGKYPIEFTVDHEPVEGAVPMITLDEGVLRTELSTMPGNTQGSGTQRTFTCDVNAHTLEGALAVNLAANLNKFLQRPINKFRHQSSDEQQPGLQIVMRVDPDPKRTERMGITFSRT